MLGLPPRPSLHGRVLITGALTVTMLAAAAVDGVAQPERSSRTELTYVYLTDGHAATMSGSVDDVARARRHRRPGEPTLWFRRDGQEYVVRDRHVLRALDGLWAREDAVDAERDVLAARQEAAGAQLARLAARERRGVAPAERRRIGDAVAALEREMLELDREMAALDAREDVASREAEARMRAWVDQVVAAGAADPVR